MAVKVNIQIGKVTGRDLTLGERILMTRAIERRLEELANQPENVELRGGALLTDAAARRLLPHVRSAMAAKR